MLFFFRIVPKRSDFIKYYDLSVIRISKIELCTMSGLSGRIDSTYFFTIDSFMSSALFFILPFFQLVLTFSVRIVANYIPLPCSGTKKLKLAIPLKFTTVSSIIFIHSLELVFLIRELFLLRQEYLNSIPQSWMMKTCVGLKYHPLIPIRQHESDRNLKHSLL